MKIETEEQVIQRSTARDLWTRPGIICLVALALRLAVVPFLAGDQLNPARDHWAFGWETGRIAQSLARGEGFGSPLFGRTGATAWMAPIYPGLVAGAFKMFGIYSKASAYAVLSLNCLFAALTCIPLHSIASRVFERRTAGVAAWIWALFPYSINFATATVWDTTLSTLLLTVAIAMTLRLERRPGWRDWVLWGALWAVAGLTEPSLLACLPVAGLWLVYRQRQRGAPWDFLWRPGVAALAFVLLVSPWFARNYKEFGEYIPFRSNFWLTFYQGNTWDTFDLYPDWANPPHNPAEMNEYAQDGEMAYMAHKKAQALAAVRENPGRFAVTTLRRVLFTWTGYWNLSASYRKIEPFAIGEIFMTSLLSVVAAWGLIFAFRFVRRFAVLFLFVFLTFPMVYYVTHPSPAYRHPLDPLLVALAAFAFTRRSFNTAREKTIEIQAETAVATRARDARSQS